jgi:diguanylate cyclase (GGDEF)-like protein
LADDDLSARSVAERYLRFEGFEVLGASSANEALYLAAEHAPNLVLLDVSTPDIGGVELCRQLRKGARTRTIPVILLGDRASTQDQVEGLEAGADDFMGKPLEPAEFVARVSRSLVRSREMRGINPLTNLPGNVELLQLVAQRIWDKRPTALLYIDLDNFKAFNDYHGFLRGDTALRLLSKCIGEVLQEHGDTFLGHIGGDDFAAIVDPKDALEIAAKTTAAWDSRVGALYSPEDVERGYIEVADRRRDDRRFPLMTVSIGIASSDRKSISSPFEFAQLASEMKALAKRDPLSAYAIDRRHA